MSSSLESYRRPPFIGDLHDRLIADLKIFIGDPYSIGDLMFVLGAPMIYIGDRIIFIGDLKLFVGDPRFSLENPRSFQVSNENLGVSDENGHWGSPIGLQ